MDAGHWLFHEADNAAQRAAGLVLAERIELGERIRAIAREYAQRLTPGGRAVSPDASNTPGWEGSIGPFPGGYGLPHVYARDVHSGAGNCVCGGDVGDDRHVQAAPGVPVPERLRCRR